MKCQHNSKLKTMMVRYTTVCVITFLVLCTDFPLAYGQSETYLYTIYYEESGCSLTPASLVGHSSGDDEFSVGGWDNNTEQCSLESTCLINNLSGVCQGLVPTSSSWNRADIDSEGKIFECDETNEGADQAVCRFLEGCNDSSKYPNCSFQLATTSDLFKNPDLIRHDNAFENDGLDVQSYMALYSNEDCSEFEGVKGIVSGETSLAMTSESMTCEKAIACALYPTGEECANNGGTTGEFYTLRTKPAASKVIECTDEDWTGCDEVDPKQCVRSEIFPSCWYRLATAKTFFSIPGDFLVGTKYAPKDATIEPSTVELEQHVGDGAFCFFSGAHLVAVVVGMTLYLSAIQVY